MKRRGLTPQGYYDSPIAGHVHYQSSYERKFMEYLDTTGLSWVRCKDRFPYMDSENKKHTYNPDFYLPDEDIYIEVKGMIRMNDPLKFEAFPKDKKLVLIDCEDLKSLGIKVFDPFGEGVKPLKPNQWPYKLLEQMPDFSKKGELSDELKERLSKYKYIIMRR